MSEKKKSDFKNASIVMGVDPGTRVTGYGVILRKDRQHQVLDYGCIRPPADLKLSDRYLVIFHGIEELLELHHPEAVVVETQFVQKNVQSAIKLGMARGIIIVAAKKKGIPVFEYSPAKAKAAVVGNGRASKCQVQNMVQHLLGLPLPPSPQDAADALSLAICHLQAHYLTAQEI
jgi:crossover junction endodeoxyribonuclease RuvC